MVKTIRVPWMMTAEWVEKTVGKRLDDRHYDPAYLVGGEALDVERPNGKLLLALRPGKVPAAARELARGALLRAARPTHKRPVAAGGAELYSGTVGWLNGEPTSFTREDRGWRDIQPLLWAMNRAFREACPDQYKVLRDAAGRTPEGRLIPFTAFTSAAVNRWGPEHNARMAVHRDDGNLPDSFGALTVIRAGAYSGGLLVFPRYRVAVDLRPGDVLIADNQEAHGNTAIVGEGDDWCRVSVVAFFHESNLPQPIA
jgi:hypothetical protein